MKLAIDYSDLSDQEMALVNNFLIELQSKGDYFHHTVVKNENVYSIIRNYIRYSDGASPASVVRIAGAVARASGIKNLNRISSGQELQIPPLPVRPFREGASIDHFQQFNLETKKLAVCTIEGCESEGIINALVDEQRQKLADTRSLSISIGDVYPSASTEIDQLLQKLGSKAVLIPTGYVEIGLLGDDNQRDPVVVNSHAPPTTILKPASLYIMDKFSDTSCAHGDLVEDVVRDTLTRLGAWDDLKNNIHKLELDFWKDSQKGLAIIRKFIDSNFVEFWAKGQFKSDLRDIENKVKNNDQTGIPALYLRALLADVEADRDTPILSASFWVKDSGVRILPNDHRFFDRTFIFAATPNNAEEIESTRLPEPQESVYTNRSPTLALVTAYDPSSVITSMFSHDGSGVEFIALGSITGKYGDCENIIAKGSSYATPQIAALAYKLANDSPQNSIIRRILLSSDIKEEFINKVQAPGPPRLDLASLGSGVYGLGRDGEIVRLGSSSGRHTLKIEDYTQPFGMSRLDMSSVAGVYFLDRGTYIFREPLWKWVQAEISSLSVVTETGTVEIGELKHRFKGVIAL
jgi:hypothetical protein